MERNGADTTQTIPFAGRWDYSRSEMIADGIVHLVGLAFAAIAGPALLYLSWLRTGSGEFAAATFYVLSLLGVLSISLAYNQWPLTPAKWVLRRLDHAMIYVLIAATYTPFLAQVEDRRLAAISITGVWCAAFAGIAVKLAFPGRFDRLAVAFYLAIGWSGVALAGPLLSALPSSTLQLIALGGLTYTGGVLFYVWTRLKYHIALWHGCVVLGAGMHCVAVIDCFVISRV